MKRTISLLLSVLMLLALAGCGQQPPAADPSGDSSVDTNAPVNFDESKIVLQFGAISDTHLGRGGAGINTVLWIKDAYKTLNDIAAQYSKKGLNAVLVSGDLTDNGTTAQAAEFAKIYETVFDPEKVPLIFSLGNHDVHVGSGSYNKGDLDFESTYASLGEKYRVYEEDSRLDIACVHTIVNGYHFLAINPLDEGYRNTLGNSVLYAEETKAWLDEMLAKITEKEPDQYVFISTHPLIYGTAYGSEHTYTTTGWFTRELTEILSKYPQAMTFGGHVHFPINSDLSIMQTTFTALQCGSVNYMSVEDGEYRDMNTAVSLTDREKIHNGYLVQVDKEGNVRVLRLNFAYKQEMKYPFVLRAPQEDGSHLLDYSWDRGSSAKNEAPVLPADAISIVDNAAETKGAQVTPRLTFKAATDDDQVHSYAVTVRNSKQNIIETQRVLADFYKVLQPEDMKTEWAFTLTGKYEKGEVYEIMLVAIDDWGVASNIVKYTYAP